MELPRNFQLDAGGAKYEGAVLYQQKIGSLELGVKEEPLYLHVETDTDWAAVIPAAAGVIVALLVAWLTVGVQKNQIQGNIANFRHHWMADLREAGSELLQVLTYLANVITQKEGYKHEQEYMDKCARASQLRAKIDLLLSRDDDLSTEIREASRLAVRGTTKLRYKNNPDLAHQKISALRNMLRAELESAWEDMKNDLGVNKRFFFIRLFKKGPHSK
ncbi:hypothetical protein [Pseudomonas putida]|uniref:Uncharacterized protein n=1 Tax=Pseudomonas putida TaxID=303 RepID=A0A1X0ZZE9_PSEPU|nr:hypothetical protein [Pseudomonas putida]ORL65006.1 hypothetical protein B7H17_09770 [Pseudomonas putida]